MMQQAVNDYKSQSGCHHLCHRPKVSEKVAKIGLKSAGDFMELADKPKAQQCQDIAHEIMLKFMSGDFDKVEMIYHHFKSAGSQILTRKTFLPRSFHRIRCRQRPDLSSNVITAKAQEYLQEEK